jgi:hypothetical protein
MAYNKEFVVVTIFIVWYNNKANENNVSSNNYFKVLEPMITCPS